MAEDRIFSLKIIKPDGVFFEGDCDFVEFTSLSGEMGVYKGHIPLTVILEPCVVRIHDGDEVKKAAVLGGFAEIQKTAVTILAEDANRPEDIDVARAEAAKERAKRRLEKHDAAIDTARAEAALKRAVARINAAS